MRGELKVLKGIFFFIMGLIMAGCLAILICALNPPLTAMLAEKVESIYPSQTPQSASARGTGGLGGLLHREEGGLEEEIPGGLGGQGINTGWMDGQDVAEYEIPETEPVEAPEDVSGRTGYEPVREEAEQIEDTEADSLPEADAVGETGSDLDFGAEYYPYYAMLEPDMQQIYSQIYANALALNASFAPVTAVSVYQLKNVFEAVYNDHPELFWLETGYSCKYFRTGQCAEVTLKYNASADSLDDAKAAFEAAAERIVSQARGLGGNEEKERYVHDALMQAVEYDVSAPMNQSAYSALVGGRSVCAGYARAFQYMMQQLGIPCYYCTGYAGEDHAWDIVKIDGNYRNVDVTWDDTDTPTYDFYNKTDTEFAPTHMRTGLSVYLPACAGEGVSGGNSGNGGIINDGGNSAANTGAGTGDGAGNTDGSADGSGQTETVSPAVTEPLRWESVIWVDPVTEEQTAEEENDNALERAGITEDQVRDTMQEYYDDCGKQLKEAGAGDRQFTSVIPASLWNSVESAYNSGAYWNGYVENALKDMGVDNFLIQLQAEDLGGGYYRLYHNVYTY